MLWWPKWLDDKPILDALGLMLLLGRPEDPLADVLALAPFYDEAAAVAAEVAEGIGTEAVDLVSSSIGEGATAEGVDALELDTAESWGNPSTLADHFARHGADFGATSEVDYPTLNELPRSEETGGSYKICPSCGFQFGISDEDEGVSDDQWRTTWIQAGMPWNSVGKLRPLHWNPSEQLNRILGFTCQVKRVQ